MLLPLDTGERAAPQSQLQTSWQYSIYLPRKDERLSSLWCWVIYRDSVPTGSRTKDLSIAIPTFCRYTVNLSTTFHYVVGYKRSMIEKFSCKLNPGLVLLTDWIISSGNTSLSIDLLISCLEQLHRDDIVDVVQKGKGNQLASASISD